MRLLILILIILIGIRGTAQVAADSVQINRVDTTTTIIPYQQAYEEDEEMNIFLMSLAFVGISVMLGVAIATIIIVVLALLAITALIGAGILSASIGVGMYKKSFSAAVRTAVTLMVTIICAAGGAGVAVLVVKLFDSPMSASTAALIGTGAGAVGGIISSVCLFWLIKRLLGSIRQR